MRIIISILLAVLFYIPGYALEYTHSDGSHVSIHIPGSLTGAVRDTVESRIREFLPPNTTNTAIGLPIIDTDSLNLEEVIETANWEHNIDVKSVYADDNITSVLITSYEYTGGAHGSMARIGLVMDSKTGKQLTLGDFYNTKKLTRKLSPIWQKQITQRLKTIIGKNLTSDEKDWIHDGTTDIQQYQSFTITPRMLIIYGQQYQHNAYAYGMQTLTYPRYKLIDTLK